MGDNISNKGGQFFGKSHDEGGIPIVVADTKADYPLLIEGEILKCANLNKEGKKRYVSKSKYLCKCGKHFFSTKYKIKTKSTISCGCAKTERIRKLKWKHGLKKDNMKLYWIWSSIKQRIYNVENYDYKVYGGRGIGMCKEWKLDFKSFYDWSVQNGYVPKLKVSIDRIDNNYGYFPNNCRFVSNAIQSYNKRTSIGISKVDVIRKQLLSGKTMLSIAVCNNISLSSVRRIKHGKTYNF